MKRTVTVMFRLFLPRIPHSGESYHAGTSKREIFSLWPENFSARLSLRGRFLGPSISCHLRFKDAPPFVQEVYAASFCSKGILFLDAVHLLRQESLDSRRHFAAAYVRQDGRTAVKMHLQWCQLLGTLIWPLSSAVSSKDSSSSSLRCVLPRRDYLSMSLRLNAGVFRDLDNCYGLILVI